jgi:hypothetical protein
MSAVPHKAKLAGRPGKDLTVDRYLDFVKKYRERGRIINFMNFDIIGDPEASRANAEYLKHNGYQPIKVFYVQSGLAELERLVRSDPAVIAIGGCRFVSNRERIERLTEIFTRFPNANFHGLGICREISMFPGFRPTPVHFCLVGRTEQ